MDLLHWQTLWWWMLTSKKSNKKEIITCVLQYNKVCKLAYKYVISTWWILSLLVWTCIEISNALPLKYNALQQSYFNTWYSIKLNVSKTLNQKKSALWTLWSARSMLFDTIHPNWSTIVDLLVGRTRLDKSSSRAAHRIINELYEIHSFEKFVATMWVFQSFYRPWWRMGSISDVVTHGPTPAHCPRGSKCMEAPNQLMEI